MALVRLSGLTKSFSGHVAVQPLDLEIETNDFLAILGPSGCGKTTLLRMIGGFETPTDGRVIIGGKNVTRLGPEKRPTNMVFQGYGLFPHMNVRQNVAYGLRLKRQSLSSEIDAQVAEALRLVHLEAFAERAVTKLSGGQQQRVALARALVMRPAVLLLDEPLAALDLKLRKAMQEELRRLHRIVGGTFVFVTHDQGEALSLANRIAVMEAGEVVQVGGPEDIYRRPATRFVSTFIGEANVIVGERHDGVITLPWGTTFSSEGANGRVSVVVRPEHTIVTNDGGQRGEVRDVVFLGSFVKLLVRMSEECELEVHLPEQSMATVPHVGQRVDVSWRAEDVRCFNESPSGS